MMIISSILLFFALLFIGIVSYLVIEVRKRGSFPVPNPSRDSVIVITGCDSGIGFETAVQLVRKKGGSDLKEAIKGSKGSISTFPLDITLQESVDQFAENVERLLKDDKKLVGVVSNAGIALVGPIEAQPFSLFFKQNDVNFLGHVRIAQRFIPLLRTSKGRLVNTVSVAGRTAAAGMGAYAASKFAMEAVTDCLRQELYPWGISVSAIEPGFIKTPLVGNLASTYDQSIKDLNPEAKELYKNELENTKAILPKIYEKAGTTADVAKAMIDALTSPRPKTRYLVGMDAHAIAFAEWMFPDRLKDLVKTNPKFLRG